MLQFITHTNSRYNHISGAEAALKGGCRWIQLRMKDASKDEVLLSAHRIKELCEQYDATFIIDDHVELVIPTGADGVHLGKKDMSVTQARDLLGKDKIIGGTANTFSDIQNIVTQGANYVGLGPFRFTTTKKNLSEILGLDGFNSIIRDCRLHGISIPIVGIGGILKCDISSIMTTGISGIALSGAILNAADPTRETLEIVDTINKTQRK